MSSDITITTNLYDEPAYAEQVGHLSVAWANLEWHMYNRFEQMCGSPKLVARSIFYAIESNRGRRELLSAVAATVLTEPADKNVLDDILRRIGRTAGQRNKFVHDTWCVANTQKREVFQLRLSHKPGERDMDEVSLNDLKAAIDQIHKLTEELLQFGKRIENSVPASIEKLRQAPGLPLVFAKKGHNPGKKPKGFRGQK